jgi:hypothetical protein
VIFFAFNSALKPNFLTAWCIEVSVFKIAGYYIEVVQGCNEESKSDAIA